MKKKYITITIISTIIIASTIGFCFLKKNINDKTVNKSEYYKIASVEKVFINGVLTPRESESIYIDSTKGEISEVHVTDGQAVNAGDSLFTYNNPTIEAQIEEISEQITSNENSKVSINNKLTNAKNNLAEKENQLNKLKKQLEEFNFQDQVEADNISMNIQQTTAEIQAYKEQVSAYEDQIDSVKTTLNSLYNKKEKLAADKNFVVTASIGGTIVLSSNEKDYTQPYIIIESQELIVKGVVSEKDYTKIKVNDNISINIISTNETIDGKILEIDDRPVSNTELNLSQVTQTTNTNVSYYNVLITLNSQENLINGFHSQGKVTLGDDTIKVFKTSVINEEGKNYVFINRDGILDKVEILIQQEDGEYVIVESGLNANDVVMKNPTSETKAGVKVE
ncbi:MULTISPECIES: biotin/lipoyl-binding protein [unclassified Clostridium]|uniref:efflux RND transporter periplasmic adaptor subunit n=1 Tax=unclassified Clostridium TaxID=2614128 RepID=UPI0018982C09|nr:MULTISPECIES: biotin/lipoyl-binding protein [unclassified Clostridium]MBP3914782.1 biotin/lipoyl-binding protein [Clostridium sp.]MBQ9012556.1 biotin/lipoyl-binding protein [Bacilli bacterium]MEE0933015.1 biotin/lipoyl-binding protein [Clostridium sp.]